MALENNIKNQINLSYWDFFNHNNHSVKRNYNYALQNFLILLQYFKNT